jgi:hypothetical protein
MARKKKVYGGLTMVKGEQLRTLVCATTKKQALEFLAQIRENLSMSYFNNYWGETGNEEELKTANKLGIWRKDGPHYQKGNFVELWTPEEE